MHEIGLCESFLDAVERRAAGRQVTGVRLRIGVLHRVVEPALAQAFALVSAGTVADGAAVELVTVPARVACPACGRETETAEPMAACPACGSLDPELVGGDELILESIRLMSEGAGPASSGPVSEGAGAAASGLRSEATREDVAKSAARPSEPELTANQS